MIIDLRLTVRVTINKRLISSRFFYFCGILFSRMVFFSRYTQLQVSDVVDFKVYKRSLLLYENH